MVVGESKVVEMKSVSGFDMIPCRKGRENPSRCCSLHSCEKASRLGLPSFNGFRVCVVLRYLGSIYSTIGVPYYCAASNKETERSRVDWMVNKGNVK